MKRYLVALICLCAIVGGLVEADSNSLAWLRFKRLHGKVYDAEEDAMRFANFLASKQLVERHNANSSASYKMGLNHLSDWSNKEFQRLNGLKYSEALQSTARLANDANFPARLAKLLEGPVPDELDWRKVPNRVSSIKDQGDCGSCWAFSVVGLLEGQEVARNFTNKLIDLSVQELLDCSVQNWNCQGGYMMYALEDIAKILDGIESEQDYKYIAERQICDLDKSKNVISIKGGHILPKDEEALKRVVANYGPVSVGFDVTDNFRQYKRGVFTDSTCSSDEVGHGVVIVGYGHDPQGGDYWIVKNSWGLDWGEDGYFRIKRGVNMCSIAIMAIVADF